MLLTFTFQLNSFIMLLSNLCTFFENYIPGSIVKTMRFGRSNVGLNSKPFLFEVPKRYFSHFYVFASTAITITLYSYIYNPQQVKYYFGILLGTPVCTQDPTAFLVSILLAIQIYRRLYECYCVSKFSPDAKMNIIAYAVGIWHYFGTIISVFGGSRGCSGELNVFCTCVAIPIFVFGWFKQFESHKILASLRTKPNDKTYSIPKGGLFQYVSCPNYFAELLIYFSLAILFQFQNYEFNWVVLWVLSNQTYSAALAHEWYLKKFGSNYPKERKRLIPFIF